MNIYIIRGLLGSAECMIATFVWFMVKAVLDRGADLQGTTRWDVEAL